MPSASATPQKVVHPVACEDRIEDHAGEHRAHGKHVERHEHHMGALVDVAHHLGGCARAPVEGEEDEAPGVERCQQRRDDDHREGEEPRIASAEEGRLDDGILGVEARETDEMCGMPKPVSASVPMIIIQ